MQLRYPIALALSLFSAQAFSGYQSLVVLGDSLSDIGNGSIITGGVAPGTPTGRASNGPVAVEYLAARLGIGDFKASGAGGTNYAVFGATSGTQNFSFVANTPAGSQNFPDLSVTGMQTQFGQFAASGPFLPDSTLFALWGGANDIFLADVLSQDPQQVAAAAVTAVGNILGMTGGLLTLGAQNILVVGMPDLALSPLAISRGPQAQAGFSMLVQAFNDGIQAGLAQFKQLSGANLMFFDPSEVTDAILDDIAGAGFSNVTDQCILSPEALAAQCAGYAFLDEVHPTTAVHALFGSAMAAIVPEPSGLGLIVLSGFAVVAHRRRPARKATTRPDIDLAK